MEKLELICYLCYFLTGIPLAIWGILRANRDGRMSGKVFLIMMSPFICFLPCFVDAYQKGVRLDHMTIAGKIIGIKKYKVSSVLVEGYPEYIPLNCLTNDISLGDSFYRHSDAVGYYTLYKKDSTGVFRKIELDNTGMGNCTWRWAKPYE